MRIYITVLSICCIMNTNTSLGFSISKPIADKPGIIKLSNNLSASDFIKLTAKDFSLITGKKMNLWNRLSFSFLKMRMKHDLKKNPDLKVNDYYAKNGKKHLSVWWIVGIGVVILLLIILITAVSVIHP